MVKLTLLASAFGLLNLATALPTLQARDAAADAAAATTVKLMPLGASIVEITCWRAYLWKKLQDAGVTNVDFVGSNNGPASCTLDGTPVQFDKDHEGHSGAKVTDYAKNGNVKAWVAAAKPDVIVMHVGTNDVTGKIATADIIAAYGTILSQMRAQNPETVLVLSKLLPISPQNFTQPIADNIGKLNTAMEAFVTENTSQKSPIVLVDQNTGFDYKTMTRDGEHPNEAGDKFMADRFFNPVKDALVVSSVQKLMLRDEAIGFKGV